MEINFSQIVLFDTSVADGKCMLVVLLFQSNRTFRYGKYVRIFFLWRKVTTTQSSDESKTVFTSFQSCLSSHSVVNKMRSSIRKDAVVFNVLFVVFQLS